MEGKSIKSLLTDPASAWDTPAVTTFGLNNHAVRTEGWRYIHYANGDEELYNEATDPYEWTNLAKDSQYAGTKAELARHLPTINNPAAGAEKSAEKKAKKLLKKAKKQE